MLAVKIIYFYYYSRYTKEEEDNTKHCINTLCEYFTGKWANEPKPFTYTDQQTTKFKLETNLAAEPR